MTKIEMVKLGMEFDSEYLHEGKYYTRVTETYKYRGQVKERSFMEMTAEGRRVDGLLDEPMFVCPDCGKLVSFNDLEVWLGESEEDFLNDNVLCSLCYEDAMGDDL